MEEIVESSKGPLHVSMKEPYAKLEHIKNRKGKLVKQRVAGLCVDEIREMKLIDIEMDDKITKAYVDLITGSLYNPSTGYCFSSTELYIPKGKR